MSWKNLNILPSLLVLIFLGGCATAIKEQVDYEIQPLKNQFTLLETQVTNLTIALEKEKEDKQVMLQALGEQEERIENLTQALKSKIQIFPKSESKTYYSFMIRIQSALKNAGFNPGLIDGKMGSRTRAALREFQEANDLPVDGQVNKQTWILLRNYL